jgi:hypothetical protein
MRARRQVLVTGLVLGYLAAAAVTLARGGLVAGRARSRRLRAAGGGGAGLAGGRGHPAGVRPAQVLAACAAPAPSRQAVYTSPARATSLSSISPMA